MVARKPDKANITLDKAKITLVSACLSSWLLHINAIIRLCSWMFKVFSPTDLTWA